MILELKDKIMTSIILALVIIIALLMIKQPNSVNVYEKENKALRIELNQLKMDRDVYYEIIDSISNVDLSHEQVDSIFSDYFK